MRKGESRAAAQRRVAVARAKMEELEEEFAKQRRAELMDPDKTKMSYAVATMMAEHEIAPADSPEDVIGFAGSYLSPSFECPVLSENVIYPSLEHAFQSRKTEDAATREKIRGCEVVEAKRIGSKCAQPSFRDKSLKVMDELLRDKFVRNPELKKMLSETKGKLVHVNDYGDSYWGQVKCGEKMRRGKNHLGVALERLRDIPTQNLISAWLGDRCSQANQSLGFRVFYRRPGESEKAVGLFDKRILIFGRTGDVLLDHASSSRSHAAIFVDRSSARLCVVDLASSHGTFVAEKRIENFVPEILEADTTLRFGQSSRRYRVEAVDDSGNAKREALYSKIAAASSDDGSDKTKQGRFLVRVENVAYDATEIELRQSFPSASSIQMHRGSALVFFDTEHSATMALASDRDEIRGRKIRCFKEDDRTTNKRQRR